MNGLEISQFEFKAQIEPSSGEPRFVWRRIRVLCKIWPDDGGWCHVALKISSIKINEHLFFRYWGFGGRFIGRMSVRWIGCFLEGSDCPILARTSTETGEILWHPERLPSSKSIPVEFLPAQIGFQCIWFPPNGRFMLDERIRRLLRNSLVRWFFTTKTSLFRKELSGKEVSESIPKVRKPLASVEWLKFFAPWSWRAKELGHFMVPWRGYLHSLLEEDFFSSELMLRRLRIDDSLIAKTVISKRAWQNIWTDSLHHARSIAITHEWSLNACKSIETSEMTSNHASLMGFPNFLSWLIFEGQIAAVEDPKCGTIGDAATGAWACTHPQPAYSEEMIHSRGGRFRLLPRPQIRWPRGISRSWQTYRWKMNNNARSNVNRDW